MSVLGDLQEIASLDFHGRSQLQAMAAAILSLHHETEGRLAALEKKARVKVAPPVVENAKSAADTDLLRKKGRRYK